MVTKERAQQILTTGSMDNEKWDLAKQWLEALDDLKSQRREHQSELNDAVRAAADERTWQMIQGEDYGSY